MIKYRGHRYREVVAAGLPVDHFGMVYHIGDLSPTSKGTDSYEGAGLSVSQHPEEWAEIARLPGDVWTLTNPSGACLDALALSPNQKKLVLDWGVSHGYLDSATVWHLYYYDDEDDEERYFEFSSQEDAELEYEEYEEDPDARLEEVPGAYVGTAKLASEGMNPSVVTSEGIAWDILLAVYVEHETDLDGVWWHERLDVSALSAPRGVIVPSRIKRWEVSK